MEGDEARQGAQVEHRPENGRGECGRATQAAQRWDTRRSGHSPAPEDEKNGEGVADSEELRSRRRVNEADETLGRGRASREQIMRGALFGGISFRVLGCDSVRCRAFAQGTAP